MLDRFLDCAGEPEGDLDVEEICLVMAASLRREVIDAELRFTFTLCPRKKRRRQMLGEINDDVNTWS